MTIDLFAASFICRDAELGAIMQIGRQDRTADTDAAAARPKTLRSSRWTGVVQALASLLRRDRTARIA